MLPEPVPDRQTQRLLAAIKEIGVAVDSLYVNRVLLEPKFSDRKTGLQDLPSRSKLAGSNIAIIAKKYGDHRLYLVRIFPLKLRVRQS